MEDLIGGMDFTGGGGGVPDTRAAGTSGSFDKLAVGDSGLNTSQAPSFWSQLGAAFSRSQQAGGGLGGFAAALSPSFFQGMQGNTPTSAGPGSSIPGWQNDNGGSKKLSF